MRLSDFIQCPTFVELSHNGVNQESDIKSHLKNMLLQVLNDMLLTGFDWLK